MTNLSAEELGFTIEDRGRCRVLVWCGDNGCRPASDAECAMWDAIAAWQRAQSAGVPEGFRVMKPTSAIVRDGERWEIYAPCGSGGIVHEDDVTDWVVRKLLDALAAPAQPAAHDQGEVQRLREALASAEKNERHRNNSETRYWCDQYKQLARAILSDGTGQEGE